MQKLRPRKREELVRRCTEIVIKLTEADQALKDLKLVQCWMMISKKSMLST
jgi:hypothetical protein